jgi:APA family basic amino acid/polyamine antiporter
VAPLGIVMCGAMMSWLPMDTWLRLLVWTIVGTVIYFAYSAHNARPPRFVLRDAVPAAAE